MPLPKNPMLGAQWLTDPAGAAARVAEALVVASDDRTEAAKLLGISRRTMFRWLREHSEEIAKARAERSQPATQGGTP